MYYKLVHDDDDSYPGCDDHYLNAIYRRRPLLRRGRQRGRAGSAYEELTGCEACVRGADLPRGRRDALHPEAEHARLALNYLGVADDFMLTEQPDIDAASSG